MTATVTPLSATEHYPPCQRDVYGRAVMALLDLDCEITAARVRGWVGRFRETAECGCLALQIKSLETVVGRYRKAFNACLSEDNAERLAVAGRALARLRAQR